MKYTVRKSVVEIVGRIWLPPVVCNQTRTLSDYDVENCRDEAGNITRESVERWVFTNCGDFQEVIDFAASIEDGPETVNIAWASEAGEEAFIGCTSWEDE